MFLHLMQFRKACKTHIQLEYKFKLNVSTGYKNRVDFNVTLNLKTSAKWRVRKAIVTERLSYSFILGPICHNKPDLYYTSIWLGSLCGLQLISPIRSTYSSHRCRTECNFKRTSLHSFCFCQNRPFSEEPLYGRVFLPRTTLSLSCGCYMNNFSFVFKCLESHMGVRLDVFSSQWQMNTFNCRH